MKLAFNTASPGQVEMIGFSEASVDKTLRFLLNPLQLLLKPNSVFFSTLLLHSITCGSARLCVNVELLHHLEPITSTVCLTFDSDWSSRHASALLDFSFGDGEPNESYMIYVYAKTTFTYLDKLSVAI